MMVKAVSVRCFELFTLDGRSLGLFKMESEWQGMRLLKGFPPNDLETVIIDDTGSLFDALFGERRADVHVMKAHPDFCLRVGPPKEQP